MKKLLLIIGIAVGVFSMYAESPNSSPSELVAQYSNEQVVIAHYVNGNSLSRIKIKIEGGSVTFFSTGKDAIGREEWQAVIPRGSIVRTNSALDGALAREFEYKSTIVLPGYQSRSITIYF